MNHYEIEEAAQLLRNKPVYGEASQFLLAYMYMVNGNSDGWGTWSSGTKPAESLEKIVQEGMHVLRPYGASYGTQPSATPEDVKKAIRRVKTFVNKNKYWKKSGLTADDILSHL